MRSQTLTAHSTIARARPNRKPPQVRPESSVGPNQHEMVAHVGAAPTFID